MIRKIVISVLVILAGILIWAQIAQPAGSGFADPRLIASYLSVLCFLPLIIAIIRKLSQVNQETNRTHNRTLHQVKWAGLGTFLSVMIVKSLVRIWYIGTAQGPWFVDESWWKHLWVIFPIVGVGTAGLFVYLWRADRPYPPGHCSKCGYNLEGNVSGVCSECGEAR